MGFLSNGDKLRWMPELMQILQENFLVWLSCKQELQKSEFLALLDACNSARDFRVLHTTRIFLLHPKKPNDKDRPTRRFSNDELNLDRR